jgi:hypothetical protein
LPSFFFSICINSTTVSIIDKYLGQPGPFFFLNWFFIGRIHKNFSHKIFTHACIWVHKRYNVTAEIGNKKSYLQQFMDQSRKVWSFREMIILKNVQPYNTCTQLWNLWPLCHGFRSLVESEVIYSVCIL